jgi:hypothetical protein
MKAGTRSDQPQPYYVREKQDRNRKGALQTGSPAPSVQAKFRRYFYRSRPARQEQTGNFKKVPPPVIRLRLVPCTQRLSQSVVLIGRFPIVPSSIDINHAIMITPIEDRANSIGDAAFGRGTGRDTIAPPPDGPARFPRSAPGEMVCQSLHAIMDSWILAVLRNLRMPDAAREQGVHARMMCRATVLTQSLQRRRGDKMSIPGEVGTARGSRRR